MSLVHGGGVGVEHDAPLPQADDAPGEAVEVAEDFRTLGKGPLGSGSSSVTELESRADAA